MLAVVGLKICRYLLSPELASWYCEKKRPPPDGHEGIEDNRRPIGGEGGEGGEGGQSRGPQSVQSVPSAQ